MRIALYSDLHTEFDRIPWTPPPLAADVLVFAGDNVTSPAQMQGFAETVERTQPDVRQIIYVCGNHEFYGSSVRFGERGYAKYRAALAPCKRSLLLEMDRLDFSGVRLIGATMWTPVPSSVDVEANDYNKIRIDHAPYRKLQPRDIRERHRLTLRLFDEARENPARTVVITHHPPSRVGLGLTEGDASAADLDELVAQWQPAAWLHGHVHKSHDDLIGTTRIISNPRGYFPDELNPNFAPTHVLTI